MLFYKITRLLHDFYIIVNFILNQLFSFEQPTENYINIAINIIKHNERYTILCFINHRY